jgi:hypothetical protein
MDSDAAVTSGSAIGRVRALQAAPEDSLVGYQLQSEPRAEPNDGFLEGGVVP